MPFYSTFKNKWAPAKDIRLQSPLQLAAEVSSFGFLVYSNSKENFFSAAPCGPPKWAASGPLC